MTVVVAVVADVVIDTDVEMLVLVCVVVIVVILAWEPSFRPMPTKAPPALTVLGFAPALTATTIIELPALSLPIEGPVGICEPRLSLRNDLPVSLSRKS